MKLQAAGFGMMDPLWLRGVSGWEVAKYSIAAPSVGWQSVLEWGRRGLQSPCLAWYWVSRPCCFCGLALAFMLDTYIIDRQTASIRSNSPSVTSGACHQITWHMQLRYHLSWQIKYTIKLFYIKEIKYISYGITHLRLMRRGRMIGAGHLF